MMRCDKCKKEERDVPEYVIADRKVHLCVNCTYKLLGEWGIEQEGTF